jgi:transcriptional regulator with XRE-family HTH domain
MSWASDARMLPAAPGVGALLRSLREARGVSQRRTAIAAGLTAGFLSRAERGQRGVTTATARAIGRVLELSRGERALLIAAAAGLSKDDLIAALAILDATP